MRIIFKILFTIILVYNSLYAGPIKILVTQRLSNFIEWPEDIENSFKIGIYGSNDFYEEVKQLTNFKCS
jgi:hypothetical protein